MIANHTCKKSHLQEFLLILKGSGIVAFTLSLVTRNQLRDAMGRLTQKQTAEKVGLKPEDVSRLLTGTVGAGPDKAEKLCSFFKVSMVREPEYEDQGVISYSPFPFFERPVMQINKEAYLYDLSLPTQWFPQYGEVGIIKMQGDSMLPTLTAGDVCAVDFTKEIQNNGLYVVRIQNTLQIARLQRLFDGTRIVFDNTVYKEMHSKDANGGFEVIGRVVWCGKTL